MTTRSFHDPRRDPEWTPDYGDLPATVLVLIRKATNLRGAWVGNDIATLQVLYEELMGAIEDVWSDGVTETFTLKPVEPR